MNVSFVIFGILMPVVGVILLVYAMIAYRRKKAYKKHLIMSLVFLVWSALMVFVFL